MQEQLLDFLADPGDGGPLTLHAFETHLDSTRDGVLLNPRTRDWYVIQDGIPTLFVGDLRPDDNAFKVRYQHQLRELGCEIGEVTRHQTRDFARIASERRARDEQAEKYDQLLSMKMLGVVEAPVYKRAMSADLDSPLFEAGCGTGRLTHIFAAIAPVVIAADMSRDSIVRNRARHHGRTRNPVYYVHCDLTHQPFRDDAFGRCANAGVYEHIPSRDLRLEFLQHTRRTMRHGGTLLLSAYRYGGVTKLLEKEGEHDGGIPFFRFSPEELKTEVGTQFHIEKFVSNLGIYMSMIVGRAV